jgi:triacylglycerol lipase
MRLLLTLCLLTLLPLSADTIVCVHGLARTHRNMNWIARSLEREGHRVVNWGYPSRHGTIEEHGAALAAELSRLASQNPDEPIHFVGHSLGGLVIRHAVNHSACPSQAKTGRCVQIAPPNRGSTLARQLGKTNLVRRLFRHGAGQQFATWEPSKFDTLGHFPPTMDILVIVGTAGFNPLLSGPNDGKVTHTESHLDTPHTLKRVRAGHSWICHWPSTIQLTKEHITRGNSSVG